MSSIRVVTMALVLSAFHSGCEPLDDGIGPVRSGILFINDWHHPVEFTIEGCDQFTVPARTARNDTGVSGRYNAACESGEAVYTVRAFAQWMERPGDRTSGLQQEFIFTVRLGDTVTVYLDYSQYDVRAESQVEE